MKVIPKGHTFVRTGQNGEWVGDGLGAAKMDRLIPTIPGGFWFAGCCGDWFWDRDSSTPVRRAVHEGWRLASNVRLGTYVQVMCPGRYLDLPRQTQP